MPVLLRCHFGEENGLLGIDIPRRKENVMCERIVHVKVFRHPLIDVGLENAGITITVEHKVDQFNDGKVCKQVHD